MNKKQTHIKQLLQELSGLMIDNHIKLNKIPYENGDMEKYEGTPVEDLVNSSYFNGKMDMLNEIKDILISDL